MNTDATTTWTTSSSPTVRSSRLRAATTRPLRSWPPPFVKRRAGSAPADPLPDAACRPRPRPGSRETPKPRLMARTGGGTLTTDDPGRGEAETAAAQTIKPAGPGESMSGREAAALERIEAFRRRRPRFRDDFVTLAHGAGGKASAALIDAVFLDAFRGLERPPLTDAALIALPHGETLAFTTDSFVVKPLRFPGGSIGHLAVHGTVNDLAVMGAHPHWLSAAFVIEEGFAVNELRQVVADMAEAAATSGVTIVTGDTKVVDRGAADGLYVTTAGIGLVPAGRRLGAELVQRGDRILISGTIADHGMAVMLARGDLALEAELKSDTAPVTGLVEALFSAAPSTRWLRD